MNDDSTLAAYSVQIGDYFEAAMTDVRFRNLVERCRPAMSQIIARYRLGKDNSVLSLGSGEAFEEYWFHRAGCCLTLNDIERTREGLFRGLPRGPDRYVFGDAGQFVAQSGELFDVLYISSFHPDEMRRADIQARFCLQRSELERLNYQTWPAGTEPYHPTIESALQLVRRGGLVILQHYCGGVDINFNSHYFDDVSKQFYSRGVTLVEEHHFRRSPQHLLLTARKGGRLGADLLSLRLAASPAITTFHGRYGDTSINADVVHSTFRSRPLLRTKKWLRSIWS